MKIVTGCDAAYAPGAKALLNSIRQHSPGFDCWCLVYGDDALCREMEAHGFKVVQNPAFPDGLHLPTGTWFKPHQMPAMYARILIPKLFPEDSRAWWLDADTIVKLPLDESKTVDMKGRPVAAVGTGGTVGTLWSPVVRDNCKAFGTGVLLIDIQRWNELKITEKCFQVIAKPPYRGSHAKHVVETILNHVVHGNCLFLDPSWERNPKRDDPPANTKVHHWGNVMPWTEVGPQGLAAKPEQFRLQAAKHWEPYR